MRPWVIVAVVVVVVVLVLDPLLVHPGFEKHINQSSNELVFLLRVLLICANTAHLQKNKIMLKG